MIKLKAAPYTAAGQVESRFVRRFTPAIEQKPEEAQKPRKESYKRQQTLLLPGRKMALRATVRRLGDLKPGVQPHLEIWSRAASIF